MAGEWRFNPSVHRAKGDRVVRARALSVCENETVYIVSTSVFNLTPQYCTGELQYWGVKDACQNK